jgi:hypothetical protein
MSLTPIGRLARLGCSSEPGDLMSATAKARSADDVMFVRKAPSEALPELKMVVLLRPAETDAGVSKPSGSTGTIVGVWAGGEAYEVEFSEPEGALATVRADDLRPA